MGVHHTCRQANEIELATTHEGIERLLAGTFQAWGATTKPATTAHVTNHATAHAHSMGAPGVEVLASFTDHTPAVVSRGVGTGMSVHFYFFPATSMYSGCVRANHAACVPVSPASPFSPVSPVRPCTRVPVRWMQPSLATSCTSC